MNMCTKFVWNQIIIFHFPMKFIFKCVDKNEREKYGAFRISLMTFESTRKKISFLLRKTQRSGTKRQMIESEQKK